jgi:hypothetical protein
MMGFYIKDGNRKLLPIQRFHASIITRRIVIALKQKMYVSIDKIIETPFPGQV